MSGATILVAVVALAGSKPVVLVPRPGETDYRIDGMSVNDPAFNRPLIQPLPEFTDHGHIDAGTGPPDKGAYSGGRIDYDSAYGRNTFSSLLRLRFSPRLAWPRLSLLGDDAVQALEIPRLGVQGLVRVSGPILRDRIVWAAGAALHRSTAQLRQTFRSRTEAFAERTFPTSTIEGQAFARVDVVANARHRLWATTFVRPTFVRRPFRRVDDPHDPTADFPGMRPTLDPLSRRPAAADGLVDGTFGWDRSNAVHAIAAYQGRSWRDRVQLDTRLSFLQGKSVEAWRLDDPTLASTPAVAWLAPGGRELVDALEQSSELEGSARAVAACADRDDEQPACPVRRWTSGGIGTTQWSRSRRVGGIAALTHNFTLLGRHAVEYGAEVEHTERRRSLRRSGVPGADTRRVTAQNYAAYVQDEWQPFQDVTLSPGVRWDAQDVRDEQGHRAAFIADNVAPRAAAAYDWTTEGRSELSLAYGRHFQQLPLALFEGTPVVGRLRGQYNHRFLLSYQHEVVTDLILGVGWLHQSLGRAVVPVAVHGRDDFVLTNPDAPLLRNIDAFTASAHKVLSRRWFFDGRYTYARELGNYDGLADPITGFIDRAASMRHSSPDLVRNGFGPLTSSTPHRFSLDVFRWFDFEELGTLLIGAGVRVTSGRPLSLKAATPRHPGAFPVYLLPRGTGGRLQPVAQLDVRAEYFYPLNRHGDLQLGVGARLYNITNANATVVADDTYTRQNTRAIAGGELVDVKHAKVQSAAAPAEFFRRRIVAPAPDFGRAVAYQLPVNGQFELTLVF